MGSFLFILVALVVLFSLTFSPLFQGAKAFKLILAFYPHPKNHHFV
jgi:hypothetical protein